MISVILHSSGLTWKVLEVRAIQISKSEVIRFAKELLSFLWLLENLVFLDEVSFDNRDMIRRKGFVMKGEKLFYRDEFNRKPRVSLLCFIGVSGLLDTFLADGTFDRIEFARCCESFALKSGQVFQFPKYLKNCKIQQFCNNGLNIRLNISTILIRK
jgi:hypothetical protein